MKHDAASLLRIFHSEVQFTGRGLQLQQHLAYAAKSHTATLLSQGISVSSNQWDKIMLSFPGVSIRASITRRKEKWETLGH